MPKQKTVIDTETRKKQGYNIFYKTDEVKPYCLLCSKPLRPLRPNEQIRTKDGVILVKMCSCAGVKIDLNRFRTIFEEPLAGKKYQEYCKDKTKSWKPKNPDTGSLKSFISKHGEVEGSRKYFESLQKKITTNIEYFMSKGLSKELAEDKLADRQNTTGVERFVERLGVELGVKKWISRNKDWRDKLPNKEKQFGSLNIEKHLIEARDKKIKYMDDINLLTALARRMFRDEIFLSPESIGYPERHLDHRFSKNAGYHLGVSPILLSAPVNLKWLTKEQNLAKKDICEITLAELTSLWDSWILENEKAKHFNDICEAVLRHRST